MKLKKTLAVLLTMAMAAGVFAGCSSENGGSSSQGGSTGGNSSTGTSQGSTSDFDSSSEITVVSREASSGTRSAFSELMKIVVEDENGNTSDNLFSEAVLVDSTDAVAAKVEVDPFAIGYTSLGAVNDTVVAVDVDGVAATVENIKNGSYKVSRPFVLATNKDGASDLANDFIAFVTSAQGQKIVEDEGYIASVEDAAEYTASGLEGKLTLSGSTSVEGVIEVLREQYIALNPGADIEITYSGSGAGIKDVTGGVVDIGMSSRELTDDETATLEPHIFALDGIAVIVNKENPNTALTSDQITSIFTGETRTWADVK